MTKVKVANSGPAALMVLNPKGAKKMAVKKRRTTRRRARRSNLSHHGGHSMTHHGRRHNPTTHHKRRRHAVRRHRNPAGSLLTKGLTLATGAALVQFTLGFIPPIGGVSALADAGRTLGVGWLLSKAAHSMRMTARYGDDVFLAAATLAGGKIISSFVLPFANRLFAPKPPPEAVPAGVQGIAAYRLGMNPYHRSYGLGGIATYYPGQQPFSEFVAVA